MKNNMDNQGMQNGRPEQRPEMNGNLEKGERKEKRR